MPEDRDESDLVKELRGRLRDAERRAASAEAVQTENAELRTELAYATCGVELNDAQRRAVGAVVDEVTPDAIRSAYIDLGFAGPTAEESEAWSRRAEALTGGGSIPPMDLSDRIAAATSPEEVVQLLASAEPGA